MKGTIPSCEALIVPERDLVTHLSFTTLKQSSASDGTLYAFLSSICST